MTIQPRKTKKLKDNEYYGNRHWNQPTSSTLRMIREQFIYFPDVGEVVRLYKRGGEEIVSEKPLRHSGATPTIRVNKQTLTIAAIAWYLHYRVYPHKTPGFVDGDKRNFRLVNLRYKY